MKKLFYDERKNHYVKIDKFNREIFYHDLNNDKWARRWFDKRGNVRKYINSNGTWIKRKFDKNDKLIYSSENGMVIRDKRNPIFLKQKIGDIYLNLIYFLYIKNPKLTEKLFQKGTNENV